MADRSSIPVALRLQVIERAQEQCEYCLLHQDDTPFTHHLDHIIPLKHGGLTTAANLALACLECNRYKGPNLAGLDPLDGQLTPLFSPRLQDWSEHFALDQAQIIGVTAVGRTTVTLLRLNHPLRLIQRQHLIEVDRYPP